jgi:hypothetical protein
MTATAMLVFGIDLGGPGDPRGWKIPTRDGHPAVDWYDPSAPDYLDFRQQAAAHLLAVKGVTPERDGFDSDIAEDLWGVHLVFYGADHRKCWLLVTHETNESDRDAAEPLNMRELVEHESEWTTALRAALDALGIPEPTAPSWFVAAHEL